MKTLLFLSLVTFCFTSKAQDSLVFNNANGNGIETINGPYAIVRGENIRRFPGANFFKVVEACFPWVFTNHQNPSDFNFVINGHLLTDITTINVNDLEEIAFSRNNIFGALLPFSKSGTFFIKLKQATEKESKFSVNSSAGIKTNVNNDFLIGQIRSINYHYNEQSRDVNNHQGFLQNNHISYSTSFGKHQLYTSGQFNWAKGPIFSQSRTLRTKSAIPANYYISQHFTSNLHDYSLLLNYNYQITPSLQLTALGNYFKNDLTNDSTYGLGSALPLTLNNFRFDLNSKQLFGSLSLNWQITEKIQTIFSAEYKNSKRELERNSFTRGSGQTPIFFTANTSNILSNDILFFTHKLSAELINSKRINAHFNLYSSWYKPWYRSDGSSQSFQNNIQTGYGYSYIGNNQSFGIFSPSLQLKIKNALSIYGGLSRYLIKEVPPVRFPKSQYYNNYYGAELNVKKALGKDSPKNGLHILFNHSEHSPLFPEAQNLFPNTPNNFYWPETALLLTNWYFLYDTEEYRLVRSLFTSVQVSAGILKNRILLSIDWSRLRVNRDVSAFIPIGFIGPVGTVPGFILTKGYTFSLSGKIIDKKNTVLFTRINLFQPEQIVQSRLNGKIVGGDTSSLRLGSQMIFTMKRLSIQTNCFARFTNTYVRAINNRGVVKKYNDFALNNVMVSYTPALKKSTLIKHLTLFVQAQNLVVSNPLKEINIYLPIGNTGLNLEF